MNVDMLKKSGMVIFETVSGSHAYGTNIATSDEDIRGIFMLPRKAFMTLQHPAQQVSDEKQDVTYYELRRFFELAAGCNPNIIELLWMPKECVRVMTPVMAALIAARDIFLSTKAYHTFSGYAFAQIKKAKGQNKWVNNPQPKDPPCREDFCYLINVLSTGEQVDAHTRGELDETLAGMPCRPIPYQEAVTHFMAEPLNRCRVAAMEHIPNLYRLYSEGEGVFRGGQLVCDSIPIDQEWGHFNGLLLYNEQAYDAAMRDHKNYWEWVKNRNDARWVSQERGEIDYDAKNLMHCMRLMMSGESILLGNGPIVRFEGEQLQFLKDIRAGRFGYDDLMAKVEARMAAMEVLKEKSVLRHSVDMGMIEKLYEAIMEESKS